MLEGEDDLAASRVRHPVEAELLLHVRAHQQLLRLELLVHLLIAGDVDRDVVRMIDRHVVRLLDEVEVLVGADGDRRHRILAALAELRRREEHFLVEVGDRLCTADRDPEVHIGDRLRHATRELARLMYAKLVPPGCGCGDQLPFSREAVLRALQLAGDALQVAQGRLQVGHADADLARKRHCFAARHVELLAPGVDPHIAGADHAGRIAREAEALAEEQHGRAVIRHPEVDVLEQGDRAPMSGVGKSFFEGMGKGVPSICFTESP